MKVREPIARPLDVVILELLLSASQAFLAGVLMYLAVGIWDDRDVGSGPVAMILLLLALAVGGTWLYWLLGGSGWPMAAANVPAAIFLGVLLVFALSGDRVIRLDSFSVLLSLGAAIYGVVCGAFLDSPRRWRWDQRQKLRPGTPVPRISPTTRAVAARIPRRLPKREAEPPYPPVMGPLQTSPGTASVPGGAGVVAVSPGPDDARRGEGADVQPAGSAAEPPARTTSEGSPGSSRPPGSPEPRDPVPSSGSSRGAPVKPRSATPTAGTPPSGPIELPTSVEPRAQRSPWAWAAPPEWNRDEDDEPPSGGSSGHR